VIKHRTKLILTSLSASFSFERGQKTKIMDLKIREDAYKMAIEKWGAKAQLEMAQEEATELALAVRKHIRKNDETSFSNLVEEIADVEIMIEQIVMMHNDFGFRQMVDAQKAFKISRLLKRMNENSFEALEKEKEATE
jgi:NTP pyrophosphatase (non-canonical NTP hydrolase)|tara:strand:- start:64511 stop:64924 length:414 start_codon:yes stop_codon:yes gene_type:complete